MKTTINVVLVALAFTCIVALHSCNKNEEISQQEIKEWQRKDWVKDGLKGSVEKVVTYYPISVKWDTLTQKATPSDKTKYQEVVEYNQDGYRTWSATTYSYATDAISLPNGNIVITKNEELPREEHQYNYDAKNRIISDLHLYCNYYLKKGEYNFQFGNYTGDTIPTYGYNTTGPLIMRIDTAYADKYEYTYDDVAKIATRIYYSRNYQNGSWRVSEKRVFGLNSDGYIDESNYTYQVYYPKANNTNFEEKPSTAQRGTFDEQGNWIEQFSWSRNLVQVYQQGSFVKVWQETISDYKRREIMCY